MKKRKIFFILFLVTFLTSCADFFQSKVPMMSDKKSANLEDLLVEKIKGGQLETTANIYISQHQYPSAIDITWDKVENAVAYRIEFAEVSPDNNGDFPLNYSVPDEDFRVIVNYTDKLRYTHNIKETTITDYNERYNKRFYYRVIAMNDRDGFIESLPSPSNKYGTLFGKPLNVEASAGIYSDQIVITWDLVRGASRYDIYRSDNDKGAGAVKINNNNIIYGNVNVFSDKINAETDKGKEFFYTVKAINNNGINSEQSSFAMGFTRIAGAPPEPKNVAIVDGKGRGDSVDSIEITWDLETVEDGNSKLTYNIFRQSSEETSLLKVGKDISVGEFIDNKNLKPNVYYYYLVQAVITKEVDGKKEELKSSFSKPVEGYILSAPINLKAKNVNGGVKITWDKPIGNDEETALYTYKIYTSDEIDGPYLDEFDYSGTVPEYIVGNPKSYFRIKTVNKNGILSNFSKVVAPAPEPATFLEVSRADYSFLDETLQANVAGVYPVKINWKKPSNGKAFGYNVLRSLKEDSGYRQINENVITEMQYIDNDSTLKPGKTYYYKILSVNSLEQGENLTEPSVGWGALTHERYLIEFNQTILSSQKKLKLMHKPNSLDKIGEESYSGELGGTVYYNAAVQGLGAYIVMEYTNYADFLIDDKKPELGPKFILTGNSDTKADMNSNGNMIGKINCEGMYPGAVDYSSIQIKGGAAGGGTYGVFPKGSTPKNVIYSVLEN